MWTDDIWVIHEWGEMYFSGAGMTLSLFIMYVWSFQYIRRRWFEWFFRIHWLGFLAIAGKSQKLNKPERKKGNGRKKERKIKGKGKQERKEVEAREEKVKDEEQEPKRTRRRKREVKKKKRKKNKKTEKKKLLEQLRKKHSKNHSQLHQNSQSARSTMAPRTPSSLFASSWPSGCFACCLSSRFSALGAAS